MGWGSSVRTHTGGTCRGDKALPLLRPLRAPGAAHGLRERRGSGAGNAGVPATDTPRMTLGPYEPLWATQGSPILKPSVPPPLRTPSQAPLSPSVISQPTQGPPGPSAPPTLQEPPAALSTPSPPSAPRPLRSLLLLSAPPNPSGTRSSPRSVPQTPRTLQIPSVRGRRTAQERPRCTPGAAVRTAVR